MERAAADRVERAADIISTGADRIQGSVSSSTSELNSASDRVRDSAASLGGAISTRAGKLQDGVTDLTSSAADATRDFTVGALGSARDAAASAKHSASETAKGLRDKASDFSDRRQNLSGHHRAESNPRCRSWAASWRFDRKRASSKRNGAKSGGRSWNRTSRLRGRGTFNFRWMSRSKTLT